MRSPYTLPLLLALPSAITAVNFDCKDILVDKAHFNLSPLGGPKSVHSQIYGPPSITNTTYTLDLCGRLPKNSDIDKALQCPYGTQVCGIEEDYNLVDGKHEVVHVKPIAGEFTTSHGRGLDPKVTRLKGSAAHEDAEREGVRIELNGGKYPENKEGRRQKAIIEMICDPELTGLEGFEEEKKAVRRAEKEEGDGDDEVELPDLDKGKSLQFVSYRQEGDEDSKVGVLRLKWKSKYACEGAADAPPPPGKGKTGGWGFFTWFLIMYVCPAASPADIRPCHFYCATYADITPQRLPPRSNLHHLRLLAQLQPLRRPRLGPHPARRHDPRSAVYC